MSRLAQGFLIGDEVKVRDDIEPRQGIYPGMLGRVNSVTSDGAVLYVFIYQWGRTYVYGASDIEHRGATRRESGEG